MTHEEFSKRLDDWADGLLPEPESRAMQQHAHGCAACAAEAAAARVLAEAARALPRDLDPQLDPWPGIESALRARTAGSTAPDRTPADPAVAAVVPLPQRHAGARAPRRRVARVVVWLAAASLTACAGLVWYQSRSQGRQTASRTGFERDAFAGLVAGLERECYGAGQALQATLFLPAPGVPEAAEAVSVQTLSDAVAILDQAIAETGTALTVAPGDERLQALLAARYRQKLALLNAALVRMDRV